VLDGVLWVEPKRGETLEQRRNCDLSLRSGERSAQAVMVSTAKGEMGAGSRAIRTVRTLGHFTLPS
jgi:hypothetical protein